MLTVGLAGFVILSAVLVLFGGHIAEWASEFLGFGLFFEVTWKVLQWPLVFILMVLAIGIIYYVCPDVEQDWRWVTPGAVVAVLLWLCVSLAFKVYVTNFGNYNAAYGSIGGVIVLMLWLYLSGTVSLLGGEIQCRDRSRGSRPCAERSGLRLGRAMSPGQSKKPAVVS